MKRDQIKSVRIIPTKGNRKRVNIEYIMNDHEHFISLTPELAKDLLIALKHVIE